MTPTALSVLAAGADSYLPFLQTDGELHDPVVGAPTQYGTPYFAWCNAILAEHGDPERRTERRDAALRGLGAAVRHVLDPELPATWSGFDRITGAAAGALSHRDFFWPPILKSALLLRDGDGIDEIWRSIERVEVPTVFRMRPPSNWAMVWCSGEWLRIRAGASPTTLQQFDDWLAAFLDSFVIDLGLYVERGIPNAYDLFTRVHLAEIMVNGYTGRHRDRLLEILGNGMHRSLAMQLSDGSVASGFRSTGQTWTLGAQIVYFTHCRTLGLADSETLARADDAADRAFTNLAAWQRLDGEPFSPVQNLQPSWRRVGYEAYTADGHYASLALGFLATAVAAGYRGPGRADIASLDTRPTTVRVEQEPTHRATAHRGGISLAVQADADQHYDGNGLVDITYGAGRLLQIASSTRHLSGGPWINPGLAVRTEPARTPTTVVSGLRQSLTGDGLAALPDGVALQTVLEPGDGEPTQGWGYLLQARIIADGVAVEEATPGHPHYPVLLLPYPADLGAGLTTTVTWTEHGAVLELARPAQTERLELIVDVPITGRLDLATDYANRRAICGVIRLDLAGPREQIGWRLLRG